ncbi:unnamed protein product [Mytilus coruscus]|uniref:EGF-like domain-containing protein n=1 Tax=Mytilus coruscus TaxID=42192 RepID=A0A6J8CQW5_MYTCO|nr:unnamed protein product [Mytilus coruscus]
MPYDLNILTITSFPLEEKKRRYQRAMQKLVNKVNNNQAKETRRKDHLYASKRYTENQFEQLNMNQTITWLEVENIKNEYIKTTSANFTLLETKDLEGTLKKDHSYDFKEPGVLENSIHLLLKNCSNNTTNYNCKLLFMNCSKHCIKCVSQGVCKGCEVGFYGQTCHLKCLINCGADGCNQHTGKCDGSGGKDDKFKQRGITTTSFDDETRETIDFEGRPYKTHRADLGDNNYTDLMDNVTLKNCTNNTIDNNGGLWLKNCSNNSVDEDDIFKNCSNRCIECRDWECKGCKIGFYGQHCHLRCVLDCGVEGCYQFTGKCQGILNDETNSNSLIKSSLNKYRSLLRLFTNNLQYCTVCLMYDF